MRTKSIKYMLNLMTLLGIFLTSCTNTTEPLSHDSDASAIKKIEYTPTVAQAKTQTESVMKGIFKSVSTSFIGSKLLNNSLAKSNDGINYTYQNDWHTWNANMGYEFDGIDNLYQLDYLSKIQFQDGTSTSQVQPNGAKYMFMFLNSHASYGFVSDDPYGDEVWFNYEGVATPLLGNPSRTSIFGNYERRWVGDYSEDGENWELIEIHYNVDFGINDVEFFYDSENNDFYLNGIVAFYMNGFKILARFTNSRIALVEVYGGDSTTDTLIETYQYELPNYYQTINIPSLEYWDFNLTLILPTPIIF